MNNFMVGEKKGGVASHLIVPNVQELFKVGAIHVQNDCQVIFETKQPAW